MSDCFCWKCNHLLYKDYVTGLCICCQINLTDKISDHRRRARKQGREATLTHIQWAAKLKSSQGYCHYCHEYFGYQSLVLEHFISIAKGGGTTAENCIPACAGCNRKRWSEGM